MNEILIGVLQKEEVHIVVPNLKISVNEILASECYKTLQKIKAIIENDSLDDVECFAKIEEIIRVFENIGISGGNRHNF